jgi:hypothetical protein
MELARWSNPSSDAAKKQANLAVIRHFIPTINLEYERRVGILK